jgi:pimeloyl-ACP methyl ester carboxylesterase
MYTANNARDMERIRIALGEARISYYGDSYGTYLGTVYATMFPNRTDRVVLDSSVDPASAWRDRVRALGPAAELRFPDLTSFVAARDATYHLGATTQEVAGVYFRLIEELQAQPMTIGQRTVDGTVLRQITYQSLFEDGLLPVVAPVWQFLAQAPGAPSEAEAEQLLTQLLNAIPLVPALQQIILPTALAVTCQDTAWPRSVETYQQSQALDAVLFPVAGAMSGNIWPCAFWRYPPQEPPVPITDRGPRNILMQQNLRDPATPAAGARVMKDALGSRAAMVAVDQGGHGVYGAFNRCGNEAATAWLTQGTLPPHDVLCPAEEPSS